MTSSDRPTSDGLTAWYSDHRRALGVAVALAALILLVAALAIGAALLRPGGLATDPSPSAAARTQAAQPSESIGRSPAASPAPRSDTAQPSATPIGAPIATPIALDAVTGWRLAQSIDLSPATAYVTDVAAWNGGFVAIGSRWESEYRLTAEMPNLWRSADGESWTERPIELGVDDVSLVGIATRTDGRLLLVGRTPGVATGGLNARAQAWLSDGAETWEEIEFPAGASVSLGSFDHGHRGYVLTAGGDVWFSPDGIDWRMTYQGAEQVVAGDEGFVAWGHGVVASADGNEWYGAQPTPPLRDVAPMGGDWVAIGTSTDPQTFTVWRSANGLDWVQTLHVNDLTGPDGPKTGRGLNELALNITYLTGGSGVALLTLMNNHCCAQMAWNYGVWGSSDGSTWDPMVEGNAYMSSVATAGTVTVAVGHLGRGEQPAFWIAER